MNIFVKKYLIIRIYLNICWCTNSKNQTNECLNIFLAQKYNEYFYEWKKNSNIQMYLNKSHTLHCCVQCAGVFSGWVCSVGECVKFVVVISVWVCAMCLCVQDLLSCSV